MKRKTVMRGIAVLLIAAAVSGMTGCGDKGENSGSGKLKFWMALTAATSTISANQGDTPLAKELEKKTGIEVEYIHPSNAALQEQFNIMMASDDMPDIIQYNWTTYPGGIGKAVKDGIIVDLNKKKDQLPNYISYLDSNKEVKNMVETVDGELPIFAFVRGDESLLVSQGIAMRKDWLDELGLEKPETIDEFENALRAFKEKKGASAPLFVNMQAFSNGFFTAAYNTKYGYYRDGDKIKYGVMDPGFKDFVTLMNKWCKEGLIKSDCFSIDAATQDANLLNGSTGAMMMSIGGGIGKYLSAAPDDKFDLVGVKNPVLKKGDIPEFGARESAVPPITQTYTAITESSKQLDKALKFLDYGYSDEGHMLYNFGIEGESYNMVDGYPTYTEDIVNNKDGYAMNVMLGQYTCSYSGGPFVQDKRYMEQYGGRPQQRDAWTTWEISNMKNHAMPTLSTFMTMEEQSEFALLNSSISSYASEMISKFIIGTEPISNYENMISELKTRGIERAVEINQNAYDRYASRK